MSLQLAIFSARRGVLQQPGQDRTAGRAGRAASRTWCRQRTGGPRDGRRYCRPSETNVGVGITGIAGPGGGTPEKPVGTVVIAVTVNGDTTVRTLKLFGGREMIKFQSAQAAMNLLRLTLL
jgi:hypothetical protein